MPAGAQGGAERIPQGRAGKGRLWRGLARPEDLERRRHSRPRLRADRDAQRTARRCERHAEPLHRGRGQRGADRLPLRAERQSAAGAEIRLQARLDGAAVPPRRQPAARARAGRAGRRLQRGADRFRYLSHHLLQGRRAAAAEAARAVPPHSRAGLDRSGAQAPSGPADVLVLGLHAQPLAARCRIADRFSAAQSGAGEAAGPGRRRSRRARQAECERPRAGLDHAERQAVTRASSEGGEATAPSAARGRRRFLRASLLSRAAEEHHARRRPAGRRHCRLRQCAAAVLSRRAAARRAGGVGHLRGADLPAQGVSGLSERPRIRRGADRAVRAAAPIGRGLRLRQRPRPRL